MVEKKKTSTFSKVTKVVVWLMLIAIIGSTLVTVISTFR
ncbi:stressosome-associated protein Prli42 [Enterococcus sp. BWM-S5]|uniref:Stressosome-associated protein Prli42 n=1 Tax=Enterococcus larvae TaxID=2794352 RepID=A0ABS4CGW5_9ENTE|nr:stressosome-associated protein Prli42 [Enterococcus larvae]